MLQKWTGSSGESMESESGGLRMLLSSLGNWMLKLSFPKRFGTRLSLSKRVISGTWVRFLPCIKHGYSLWTRLFYRAWTLKLNWMNLNTSETVFIQTENPLFSLFKRGLKWTWITLLFNDILRKRILKPVNSPC